MSITEKELIEALQTALDNPGAQDDVNALTTTELCERLGFGRKKVRGLIRQLMAAGKVTHVRVYRPDITGVKSPRHAYRLTGAGNAKDKRV